MIQSPPQIVATLKAKRHDIEASVKAYESKLAQARRDLAHVQATLALFATDDPGTIRAYTDTSRLFNRGEVWGSVLSRPSPSVAPWTPASCPAGSPPSKGMDAADPVLCKALAYRIVQSMTLQWKRKRIGSDGYQEGREGVGAVEARVGPRPRHPEGAARRGRAALRRPTGERRQHRAMLQCSTQWCGATRVKEGSGPGVVWGAGERLKNHGSFHSR